MGCLYGLLDSVEGQTLVVQSYFQCIWHGRDSSARDSKRNKKDKKKKIKRCKDNIKD